MLYESSDNSIYHNNFIDNAKQAGMYGYASTNVWNDGYPSGGNYWSDHAGVDADGNGIGNDEYVIDANNTDRYPLTGPISVLTLRLEWNNLQR